ncbi:NAD-dependent epimerase/dehydratase family protein [Nonomuraea soli]|uniref:Nucleoside-diphosphate-sugar epimerase n=1 Tax=Nonomuraea soli TaxID=1032476 RepID=A0A7W0CJC9_9ACTN|nr:NAD(P)-dependent oxidoreductase [Nonomuraea soli]MBA2892007.1 nucleoside-diphosphate-sugar epimerase [Nonomuraea soli]
MRILLAGATGAIGRPLTRLLSSAGHEVLALSRNDRSASIARDLGARPVMADAMDRDGLLRAVDGMSADAVIHELTALKAPKRRLTPDDPSTRLRVEGTAHLLEAAKALGADRFVTQSLILGYGYADHGSRVFTEDDPFGVKHGNPGDIVVDGLVSTEEQVLAAGGVALRYGVFHGPGTWFDPAAGSRPTPVPRGGGGTVPWVHVDDAAAATVAALERGRGGQAYNIVERRHATWGERERALRVPGWILRLMVPYLGTLMLDTTLRASGDKAERELGWSPRV